MFSFETDFSFKQAANATGTGNAQINFPYDFIRLFKTFTATLTQKDTQSVWHVWYKINNGTSTTLFRRSTSIDSALNTTVTVDLTNLTEDDTFTLGCSIGSGTGIITSHIKFE